MLSPLSPASSSFKGISEAPSRASTRPPTLRRVLSKDTLDVPDIPEVPPHPFSAAAAASSARRFSELEDEDRGQTEFSDSLTSISRRQSTATRRGWMKPPAPVEPPMPPMKAALARNDYLLPIEAWAAATSPVTFSDSQQAEAQPLSPSKGKPHQKNHGIKIPRRTVILVILAVVVTVVCLAVGLALGLHKDSDKFSAASEPSESPDQEDQHLVSDSGRSPSQTQVEVTRKPTVSRSPRSQTANASSSTSSDSASLSEVEETSANSTDEAATEDPTESSEPNNTSMQTTSSPASATSSSFTITRIQSTISTTNAAATSTSTSSTADLPGTIVTLSASEQSDTLETYNYWRPYFDAGSVTWSDTLASESEQIASSCDLEVPCVLLGSPAAYLGRRLNFNFLTSRKGNSLITQDYRDMPEAIRFWLGESKDYDPDNPVASDFTLWVWKTTTQVGCGQADCDGAEFRVCTYNPPGNSGDISENVSPCNDESSCGWS